MMANLILLTMLLTVSLAASAGAVPQLPRLKVSENHRFLATIDNRPFFYLGDTAWELFHRLNREEADRYLTDRARKGFTVIQAVALAELNGASEPDAYGHLPFVKDDPTRPATKDGANNDFWDHVDYIVDKASSLGLYVGFLPTWGRYWHDNPPMFNAVNAESYGEWLGKRYRGKGIVWILGGDSPIDNEGQLAVIRAMAKGLRRGDGGTHLITFHPPGGSGSSNWLQHETWLDFNMRQNGHDLEYTGHYENTRRDYDLVPIKPVLDGEPIYEDHPVSFNAGRLGHSIAADVRRPLYWDLFSGAFGHTYGNHAVWQMWRPGREPINNPLMPWYDALGQPGASQMQFGRKLIESRPFFSRIPDDSIIVKDRVATSVPGAGRYRFVATRDTDGTYAMVYAPVGRAFSVYMSVIKHEYVRAWWYNPRNGKATQIGVFANVGERQFMPPDPGEYLDWVLVLDDASKGYYAPGRNK